MTINRFDELDTHGVDKNWVLYATAKNICDKPMTIIIEENGVHCKTGRVGAGETTSIGCWTYGRENIRYKWNYNPHW